MSECQLLLYQITTIFAIGVDIGGQTIHQYITQSEKADGFSVVDRTGTSYEIGDASSADAYKNWLCNSIGSGYYYDSTNTSGLTEAYNKIFEEIKLQVSQSTEADWVASDPIPATAPGEVEFIKFIDIEGDKASYDQSANTINWNLKESAFTMSDDGNKKTYEIVYRVRLKNEDSQFVENKIYDTNGDTTLQYRTLVSNNGNLTVSKPKTIEFPKPSVYGYLANLEFYKKDPFERIVSGAEFQLVHADNCNICRGDNTRVPIGALAKTSNAEGKVIFENIPSGHTYTLTETKAPDGYSLNKTVYTVVVAYDKLTVTSNNGEWNGTVINHTSVLLPSTGSTGKIPYTISGVMLITASILLVYKTHRRDD